MRVAPILLALALAAVLAGAVWAGEPAPGEPPAGDGQAAAEPSHGLTAGDLEDWILEDPVALWSLLLLKYGAAAVGLGLLIGAYVRWDRVRGGLRPAPPPRVPPTTPFPLPVALGWLGGALVLVVLAGQTLAGLHLEGSTRLAVGMGFLQGILLVVAAVVIVRRRQLGAEARTPRGGAPWTALWTFLVASAFVLPAMFLSVAILQALEVPITLYGPVEEVVKGEDPTIPWLILVFSVVAAPIAEESIFRGMLYPAIRQAVGSRAGPLVAAVVTSVLFALVHWHVASFLPLFTLAFVFAFVFERTNSLAAVMGAHALWNASTMLPLLLRASA